MDFKTARQQYNYPSSHLRRTFGKPVNFENLIYVRMNDGTTSEIESVINSTLKLEEYHFGLLNSDDQDEVVLGLASIIFWGNYWVKGKPNFGIARSRTERFFKGNSRSKVAIETFGRSSAFDTIQSAKGHLENDAYGLALKMVCTLPWLSIAFGSKVLSFLCPKKVGVYDLHISRSLHKPDLAMAPTGIISRSVVDTFDKYCAFLIAEAERLNQSSESGLWSDWDGTESKWRAVDVERAYFNLAINT